MQINLHSSAKEEPYYINITEFYNMEIKLDKSLEVNKQI